jgi:uncharacterized membrane protein YdjX (TVP38/TMEM64 family)
MAVKGFTWKTWLKIIVFILFAATSIYFIGASGILKRLSRIDIGQMALYVESFGVYALAIGAAAIFLQALFPIVPFVLLAGTNVLVFGFWTGFTINYSMNALAALCAFLFARSVGREWVNSKAEKNEMILSFNRSTKKYGFWYILFARCIVILPGPIINYGSALSAISFRQYALATLIGNLPIIFLESLIGHDLLFFKHNKERLVWLVLLFIVIVAAGMWARKKWLK